MSRKNPIQVGERVKTWTVLRRAHYEMYDRPCWVLRCDCGNERIVYDQHVRRTRRCHICQDGPVPSYLHEKIPEKYLK